MLIYERRGKVDDRWVEVDRESVRRALGIKFPDVDVAERELLAGKVLRTGLASYRVRQITTTYTRAAS